MHHHSVFFLKSYYGTHNTYRNFLKFDLIRDKIGAYKFITHFNNQSEKRKKPIKMHISHLLQKRHFLEDKYIAPWIYI